MKRSYFEVNPKVFVQTLGFTSDGYGLFVFRAGRPRPYGKWNMVGCCNWAGHPEVASKQRVYESVFIRAHPWSKKRPAMQIIIIKTTDRTEIYTD